MKILSVFKDRLTLVGSGAFNRARYFMNISRAVVTNVSVDSVLNSSRAILANTDDLVLQPSIELLYTALKEKNRFAIGFELGYFIIWKVMGGKISMVWIWWDYPR